MADEPRRGAGRLTRAERSAPASTGRFAMEEPPTTRTTTSRPRMAAIYAPARCAPAAGMAMAATRLPSRPLGWTAHPTSPTFTITGRALPRAVWWIIEAKDNESSAPEGVVPQGRWIQIRRGVAAPGIESNSPTITPPPSPGGRRR